MKTDAKTAPSKSNHSVGFAALALIALALVAALLPSAALARTTRPYQSSFGAFSPSGPDALAVDQATGDVYVSHITAGLGQTISRFTAAGAPDNFTAGPSAGTNTLSGFYPFAPLAVAVDSSGGPMNGAIYVAERAGRAQPGKVRIFASSGASLGAISGAGTPGGVLSETDCGVAVDQSSGSLYIGETNPFGSFGGRIWRYTPSSPSGSIDDFDYALTGISVDHPCAVAVGSGSVYAIDHIGTPDPPTVDRFAASSFTTDFSNQPQATTIDTGPLEAGPTAIAVDPKTGDLYVDEGHKIAVFDSSGIPIYSFGAAANFGNISAAIALKSSASGPASAVYVADRQKGSHEVDVFGALAKTPTFTHPEIASFGPDGTASSTFAVRRLAGLAFDQAARRLYAADARAPGIYGFDAAAPPSFPLATGFSPLATAATGSPESSTSPGIAVDNTALGSAGNLYLASGATDLLYGWDSAGSPLGGVFPIDPATDPGPPDGSPKDLCGAAVDSAGNVWVANRSSKRILKYSPSGVSLPGAIDTSAQGEPCQLAFDTNDDLYVNVSGAEGLNSGIWKYTAASGYASAARIAASDNQGGSSGNHAWLAVDPSNHHLFVAEESCNYGGSCNIASWIDEYDAAGNLIDEFAIGTGRFNGIAVDATNHDVYLADTSAGKIRAFGPGVLLPEVTTRAATGQTNTTTVLNGLINTQTVALSDCHFEYVAEAAFRLSGFSDLSSGGSVPCSPAAGSIPLDLEEHPVSATANGLTETTRYRFRLSATNASGTDVTADAGFSSAGRPLVETTGSPIRTATTAQLNGRVDPNGKATTYHFEYGTEGPCDSNPCTSTEPVDAGSGEEIGLVSQRVEGLEPNATYHYRLIADNGNPLGTGAGAGMTVSTRASDEPLSHGHLPGPPGSDRAYEQVSLPDTGGNPVTSSYAVSDDGNRAFYGVAGGTPISSVGSTLSLAFAQRGANGWHSEEIGPPRDRLLGPVWLEPAGASDLSAQILANVDSASNGNWAPWRLRPGHPAEPVLNFPVDGHAGPYLVSEDTSRVALVVLGPSLDPAHPDPSSTAKLYDVTDGDPHLIGLLPDGSVAPCDVQVASQSLLGNRAAHSLTPDGSRLFFNSCESLYVRDLEAEETKLIASASGFVKWTPNGVFLTTLQSLAAGDGGGNDVYRYDLEDESLECVTCLAPAGLNADVGAVAVSADGSRVYFRTSARLLPGAGPAGLYRVKVAGGELAYVGSIGGGTDIGENPTLGNALSPDGSALVFASADPRLNAIGGQQNGGALQYYRYDDRDRSLTCMSCPQNGEGGSPVGRTLIPPVNPFGAGANRTTLSADGRTFAFATVDSLLPADQNTARAGQEPAVGTDVYEWRDGRLLMITDGLTIWPKGSEPAPTAIDPSGRDVFFTAFAQYTADALDADRRLYDARIGGGFVFPPPPKPCPLEVCQGTPKGAPEEQEPGSANFAGAGNASLTRRPCPKGRHRAGKSAKARCVKNSKRGNGGKEGRRRHAKHDRRAAR
ncbi:MAG TPA: hypothetical protein VN758_00890 [Solirubrobacterales bacterium]|nr:hypothetical protein [Solirubrobacterales bacterium]